MQLSDRKNQDKDIEVRLYLVFFVSIAHALGIGDLEGCTLGVALFLLFHGYFFLRDLIQELALPADNNGSLLTPITSITYLRKDVLVVFHQEFLPLMSLFPLLVLFLLVLLLQ